MVAVAVALLSLALLGYTYVGYPILVALLAKLFPQRGLETAAAGAPYEPTVTVCVPVYNASAYVAGKVDSLLAQDYPRDKIDFLFYSDGSTDGSVDLLGGYAHRDPRVKLILGEKRQGKPAALNRMRREATGDLLVLTDIRQPLCPVAVRRLVAALEDPRVGCASGNLVLSGAAGAGVYWRYESWIRRSEARFRSMVGITGPLYAMRRADLGEVPGDVILDDMWVPMRLRRQGRTILLVEAAEAYDEAFADEREFGRKVRTLAGNYQLFAKMPGLLVPFVNPSWFETFSHKVMRLLCPWAIVALALATAAGLCAPGDLGPGALWTLRALAAGQALFALMALLGARGGRLAGTARTFVVLHVAAVVGLWRFLAGSQKVTW